MIGPYTILPFRHWLDTYLILGKYKMSVNVFFAGIIHYFTLDILTYTDINLMYDI